MATSHETVCKVKTGAGTVTATDHGANTLFIVALINESGGASITIEGTDNIDLAVGQSVSLPSPIACTSFGGDANTSVVYYYS